MSELAPVEPLAELAAYVTPERAAELELTPEQTAELELLGAALGALASSFARLDAAGLEPAQAFRALGIEVPGFAAPLLNNLVRSAG